MLKWSNCKQALPEKQFIKSRLPGQEEIRLSEKRVCRKKRR